MNEELVTYQIEKSLGRSEQPDACMSARITGKLASKRRRAEVSANVNINS